MATPDGELQIRRGVPSGPHGGAAANHKTGKEGVVVISDELYEWLAVKSRQPESIVEFSRQSPLVGIELDLEREQDAGSDVEL